MVAVGIHEVAWGIAAHTCDPTAHLLGISALTLPIIYSALTLLTMHPGTTLKAPAML